MDACLSHRALRKLRGRACNVVCCMNCCIYCIIQACLPWLIVHEDDLTLSGGTSRAEQSHASAPPRCSFLSSFFSTSSFSCLQSGIMTPAQLQLAPHTIYCISTTHVPCNGMDTLHPLPAVRRRHNEAERQPPVGAFTQPRNVAEQAHVMFTTNLIILLYSFIRHGRSSLCPWPRRLQLTIIIRAATIGQDIHTLISNYRTTDRKVKQLAVHVSAVRVAARSLFSWLEDDAVGSEEVEDVKSELLEVLSACCSLLSDWQDHVA